MNSPYCSGFSGIKIVQKYAVFDRLKCEKLLRPFAFGRRCCGRTSWLDCFVQIRPFTVLVAAECWYGSVA